MTHASPHTPERQDRYFSAEPGQQAVARQLFQHVVDLPLICPHGHVDPKLFADPDFDGEPVEVYEPQHGDPPTPLELPPTDPDPVPPPHPPAPSPT